MRRKSFKPFLLLSLSVVLLLLLGTLAMADTPGWYQQASGTTDNLVSVSAVDSNTAWVGGTTCLKTSDGGSTWQPYTDPGGFVTAVDGNTAWAVGSPIESVLTVYKTTDGGNTWETQIDDGIILPSSWVSSTPVAAVDSNTAWVGGFYYSPMHHINDCYILGTTDGGATWSTKYGADNPETGLMISIWSIDAVDSNTVFAAGMNVDNAGSTMVKTGDGGASWTALTTDDIGLVSGVSAVDASNVWITGVDTSNQWVIAKSEDGGGTWTKQYIASSSPTIYGLCSVDNSTAWMVGEGGSILGTHDGGATWASQDSGVTTDLNGVSAVDPNTAWAVGDAGVILHTTTGGVILPPAITSITPTYGVENTTVAIKNLAGTGFQADATVRIEGATATIDATEVNVVSDTQITCKLNLKGAPLGKYDVVVKNPDDQEATLTGGFKVTNVCGGGAAVSLSLFGIMMGLMSLAGSAGLRRRLRRKKR